MNRIASIAAAAALALAAAGAATSATHVAPAQPTAWDLRVLQAINHFRTAHSLAPLRLARGLNAAAGQHVTEMGTKGYFAHASLDGTPFWKRIERYWTPRTYRYWAVGENLLWSRPHTTAARALAKWVASPEHLKNLLSARWRRIGISARTFHAAGGFYRGRTVVIVATDFGVRR